jgi:hypothetical protein
MKNIYWKIMEIQKLNLSVSKDSKNPYFKSNYVSLDNLVSTITPYLNEKWLLVYHYSKDKVIYTVVADIESWEIIESGFPMIDSNDPQKLWSCISYAKRYNLGQLFNIITDRDDDWNSASGKQEEKKEEVKFKCECWVEISEAVAKYSKDKFGKELCMNCQKKL